MGTTHSDDHAQLAVRALGWSDDCGYFVVKQRFQHNASSKKWSRHAPAADDKFGWGLCILTPHPVVATATVRIPAARVLGASRPASQAMGILMVHPVFGRTWVFTIHVMMDFWGCLRLDLFGSLQLQNLRAILQHIDKHVESSTCDNVLLCGDFNSLSGSSVVRCLHSRQAREGWGPWVDCSRAAGQLTATCAGILPLRLDYVFLSARSRTFRPLKANVDAVRHSDHFPLTVDFACASPESPSLLQLAAEQARSALRSALVYLGSVAFLCALAVCVFAAAFASKL